MGIATVADNNTRYHMRELQITQGRIQSDTENPSYSLSFAVEEYTLAADASRTYTGNVITHSVPDFYNEAITNMMIGDNDQVNALGAIQIVITDYLISDFGLDVEVV